MPERSSSLTDGTSAKFCSSDGSSTNIIAIVDGVQATGSYADNISLHCATITDGQLANCAWSGWVSEQAVGTKDFGGKFAVGAQCSGDYSMNCYICNVVP